MKLNICQPATARVTLPFRLCVRTQDLKAFQAQTLSHKTFVDASSDFGPEDFASDDERLAARDLARTLAIEAANIDRTYAYNQRAGSLIPGAIVIDAAFPFNEPAIQASIKEIVRLAGEQRSASNAIIQAFEVFAEQACSRVEHRIAELNRQYKKPISDLHEVEKHCKDASLADLDEDRLLSIADRYAACADELPSSQDLMPVFREAVGNFPVPDVAVSCGIYDDYNYKAVLAQSDAPLLRRDCSPPKAGVTVDIEGSSQFSSKKWSITFSLSVDGSYIASHRARKSFIIELSQLLDAQLVVSSYGAPFSDSNSFSSRDREHRIALLTEGAKKKDNQLHRPDHPLFRIGEVLIRIQRRKRDEEAAEWIATTGSESLRLGAQLSYSIVRQYRLERGQKVLNELLAGIEGWEMALASDLDSVYFASKKASPSERALKAAAALLPAVPSAEVLYAERISARMAPENGEFLRIKEGGLFPDSPEYVLFWPSPSRKDTAIDSVGKPVVTRKPRKKTTPRAPELLPDFTGG